MPISHVESKANLIVGRDVEKYSERYESDYGFESVLVWYRHRLLIERLTTLRPDVVVEVGCGSEMLYEKWLRVADPSQCWVVVEPAQRFAAKAGVLGLPNLQVIEGFFEDSVDQVLRILPRRPDWVICSGLLHEVTAPDGLLRAARAVMGPQTRLHVNVPNSESLHRRLAYAMGLTSGTKEMSERNRTLMQHRVYDRDSLRAELTDAAMRVVDEGGYLLKPFTHSQMERISSELGTAVLNGLFLLGQQMPESASEIWVEARLANSST